MAYSINPNLPKARALALKLLIGEVLPTQVVANRCGVHRSTVWRWKRKWDEINKNVQLTNDNRPTRAAGTKFRQAALKWTIPTVSSRPFTCSHAISDVVVRRVMELRSILKRCAEVIWHHLTTIDEVYISLSSVRRILKRNHAFDGARKNRIRPDNPRRPHPTKPGELVQTDTIHYICPITYKRRYVYTVIDLYSRITYAEIHNSIRPGIAADVIMRAQAYGGFAFHMVQADNGPEYSHYFEDKLTRQGIQVRHSRLGRPNDNAHIERFNRTIQEECLGNRISSRVATATLQAKINQYIEFYNTKRIHLGLQLQTPSSMLQRS
jgi:transposase InsO family protein